MGKLVSAFANDALGIMDAVAVAQAIAKKKVSVTEVTEAAITRAEKVNGDLNAIVVKTYTEARDEKHLVKTGGLYGVPSFIKDTDNLQGHPTQLGTGAFKSKIAKSHSGFLKQFLSTGTNYLGKSTMPEFGLICSTENERWGITRNPWNTDYTTGGSSSGSAALVASGVVPIATANDGAGSIRIPAACCGLVGLKPSRHRLIAMDGSQLMPLQIVYQGVLTRSVRDTALFYAEAEKFYRNTKLPLMGHVEHAAKQRLRIAFFENPVAGKLGRQDEDTYRTQLETAALLKQMGHMVEQVPVPIDIDEMGEHFLNYYGFMAYMMSHWGRAILNARVDHGQLEPFTLGLSQRFKSSPFKTPGSIRMLREACRKAEMLFEKYDAIMTPVVSHNTPPIGYFSTSLPYEEITRRAVEFASYAGMQNVSGAPAISLPLGVAGNNMPIGVHLTAPYGNDRRLLELAYEMEEAKPFRLLAQVSATSN